MKNKQNNSFMGNRVEKLNKQVLEIAQSDNILSAHVLHALVFANLKTASELEAEDNDEQGHGVRVFTQFMVKYCLGLHEDDAQEKEMVITEKMEKLMEVAHVRASTYGRFFISSLNAFEEHCDKIEDETEMRVMQYYLVTLIANVECVHKAIEREEFYTEA